MHRPTTGSDNLGDILGERRSSGDLAIISIDAQGREREWSYQDIERGSLATAEFLQGEGVLPGSRVAIVSDNSAPYLMAYLGIMRSGCVCVPTNARQAPHLIDFICRDADVCLAFIDGSAQSRAPAGVKAIPLDSLPRSRAQSRAVVAKPYEAALILYTSGSTGRPKGVVLSHDSQLAMLEAMGGGSDRSIFESERGIVAAPMFHMNALVFIALFLRSGGSTVLLSRFDARQFAMAIEKHRVTALTGVPTMIARLYATWPEIGRPNMASVSTVYIGSSPVTETIVGQALEMMPNAKVLNSYGATEIGGGIFGPHPRGIERPPTSVGFPRPHVQVRLEGDGGEGTLFVKTPTRMTEYLNLPEETTRRLKNDWFDTGDRFRTDENGFFFFVGRSDDMIVCSGENIYPTEIERVIESHAGVTQTAVVPAPDEVRGQMPVAFVVRSHPRVTEREIQEHVRVEAAPHLFPRRVWFVDALPLAGTGKVDRMQLRGDAERRLREEQQKREPDDRS